MIETIKRYLPLVFFYMVIVVMILLMNMRFANLEQSKSATETTLQIAQSK